jgi:predicted RNA binding protein YcfA (HicA-like mRNA interferase family)
MVPPAVSEAMSRAQKRLARMRSSPQQNCTIEDVQAVCKAAGVTCEPPTRGSHYTVSHPSVEEILTVPAKRPIKAVYIKQVVALIDRVEGNEP